MIKEEKRDAERVRRRQERNDILWEAERKADQLTVDILMRCNGPNK